MKCGGSGCGRIERRLGGRRIGRCRGVRRGIGRRLIGRCDSRCFVALCRRWVSRWLGHGTGGLFERLFRQWQCAAMRPRPQRGRADARSRGNLKPCGGMGTVAGGAPPGLPRRPAASSRGATAGPASNASRCALRCMACLGAEAGLGCRVAVSLLRMSRSGAGQRYRISGQQNDCEQRTAHFGGDSEEPPEPFQCTLTRRGRESSEPGADSSDKCS